MPEINLEPDAHQLSLLLPPDDPRLPHLGARPADVSTPQVKAWLGDRPLAYGLTDEVDAAGVADAPAAIVQISAEWSLIAVVYSVGVRDLGSTWWRRIASVSLEVSYPDTANGRVSIVDMAPRTDLVSSAQGSFRCSFGVDLDGNIGPLSSTAQFHGAPLVGTASASGSTSGGIVAHGGFAVWSKNVVSVGRYGSASATQVFRSDQPMDGDQLFMQTLLVERGLQRLTVDLTVAVAVEGLIGACTELRGPHNRLEVPVVGLKKSAARADE